MDLFKNIETILVAIPIMVASIVSLIDKIKKVFRWNYERKNGGNIRQKIDRILKTQEQMNERISKLERKK